MTEPNDFEIINGQTGPTPRRLPNWAWLLVILGVVLLAFAAGMAFATFATRMNGTESAGLATLPVTPSGAVANGPVSATLRITPTSATPITTLPATAVPALAATVTPTATAQATCAVAINEQLASLYLQSELGCPTDEGAVVWSAWEPFERGAMLWRSDTDRAYAFFANGAWLTIDERWDNKEIPSRGDPPSGLTAPMRGFGYVWATRDDLFQGLGWATAEEKGFCALVQSFQNGFILQSDTVEFCREQLYNQARAPEWSPLRIVATSDGIWRKP